MKIPINKHQISNNTQLSIFKTRNSQLATRPSSLASHFSIHNFSHLFIL